MSNLRRQRIPVFRKTYEKLLSKKLKLQGRLGKHITWDEFLLKEVN